MYRTLILLFAVLAMTFLSCNKGDDPGYEPPVDFQSNKKAADLIHADNQFALDFFGEVLSNAETDNFMISPLSVSIALGMTYNGAAGDTKSAFEETLRMQGFTAHEINYIHGALIEHLLRVDPKVIMEIANSIWVEDNYTLIREFADTNQFYYDAEINSLDFYAPGAVDIINGWVEDKTHDKIKEVLNEIPPLAVMYLINAIYFYGQWKYEFDEQDNTQISFNYGDGTTAQKDAMRLDADLNYYRNEDMAMVELPYGNEKFSMMIILPEEGNNIEGIMDEFSMDNWNDWMAGMSVSGVNLFLPRFKFEYKTLLNDVLSDMGLGVAFSAGADFPNMVEESDDLYISRVIHQTFVDVNEKGTEAAAVTVVEIRELSAGPGSGIPFIADRPFLFVIKEKTSNALVFMGKVGDPVYEE